MREFEVARSERRQKADRESKQQQRDDNSRVRGVDSDVLVKAVKVIARQQASRNTHVMEDAGAGARGQASTTVLRGAPLLPLDTSHLIALPRAVLPVGLLQELAQRARAMYRRASAEGALEIVGNPKRPSDNEPLGFEAVRPDPRQPQSQLVHRGKIRNVVHPAHGTMTGCWRPALAFEPWLNTLRDWLWASFRHELGREWGGYPPCRTLSHERWGHAIVVGPRGHANQNLYLSSDGEWHTSGPAPVADGCFYSLHYDKPNLFYDDGPARRPYLRPASVSPRRYDRRRGEPRGDRRRHLVWSGQGPRRDARGDVAPGRHEGGARSQGAAAPARGRRVRPRRQRRARG